ncbi:hypothetical protein [Methylophaga nitratireducenticrescens]|uniref:hypothetical protein n=1 Tax=Methylophaga nitratireducenticrescens TaxID=754476 RepID=UPI000CDC9213|nr:hypothetical protein [Methylophaga nitratireducenticrescens]AUZ86114.1 hypothetical protein CDW43_15800 [Methylophaga nitratireducenticrescens]
MYLMGCEYDPSDLEERKQIKELIQDAKHEDLKRIANDLLAHISISNNTKPEKVSKQLALLRSRNRNLMPDYMKELESQQRQYNLPDPLTLKKDQYVQQWLAIFSSKEDSDSLKDRYREYDILELRTAFSWTLELFAELDLGGNYKWHSLCLLTLKKIKKGEWNRENQDLLIAEYLADTRWFDQ